MALRDVVSYLITANDQTRGAVQSARSNMDSLRGSFVQVGSAMRLAGAALTGGAFAYAAKQIYDTGKAVADVRVEMERMRNTLGQGVGIENVGTELTFLRRTADQFGLSFTDAGIAYARFTAATRGTAVEGQETQAMFVAMAKASAALGMSADQSARALNALQQMVSKGTVSAEELRGQLGEALPGAFQIAARSMDVTTEQLGKMLEKGDLAATEMFPLFRRELEATFGEAAERAVGGTAAEVNRLGNEWQRLKEITSGGFIGEAVMTGIQALAGYLRNLNADLTAVSLGMRNFLGIANGGLSNADVEQFTREILKDPMMAGERRLSWKEPDAPSPPKGGGKKGPTKDEIRKAQAEAAKRAREEYALARERLQAEREDINQTEQTEQASVQRREGMLRARYAAGLETESAYYDQRRHLIAEAAVVAKEALEDDNKALAGFAANTKDRIDLDRQMAANVAKNTRIHLQAEADITEVTLEQTAAIRRRTAAYDEARAAQQRFLDEQGTAQLAEVEGMGLGQQERDRRAARNQIVDRYSSMRQQLNSQRAEGAFAANPEQYDKELEIINEFQQKALGQWDSYYAAVRQKHGDGLAGAREAMADFVTASQDHYSQVYGLMNTTFSSMGGVIADFAKTGEFSMRRFREAVLAELSQIATNRLLGMLLQAMGGMTRLGGSTTVGGAGWGSQNDFAMATGTNYVPHDGFRAMLHEGEAVVPKKYNPAAGGVGGANITVIQHNNFGGGNGGGMPDQQQMARMVRDTAVAGVTEAQRRGIPS